MNMMNEPQETKLQASLLSNPTQVPTIPDKPDLRVIAISHNDPVLLEIYYFGKGILIGDFAPPKETWPKGSFQYLSASLGRPQSKIVLENEDVVWGSECWWIPETEFQMEELRDYKWIQVSVQEQRNQMTQFLIEEETQKTLE